MKTYKTVLELYPEHTRLIRGVVNLVGLHNIYDVNEDGIQAGKYTGLLKSDDLHSFAIRHRPAIIEFLELDAMVLETTIEGLIGKMSVWDSYPIEADEKRDLYKYLAGNKVKAGQITTLMAWYAVETICKLFE